MSGERALVVSLTEEVGDNEGAQKGVLEGDGTKKDADENQDFGIRDDGHGAVIVGLNPDLEPLRKWRRSGRASGSCRWAGRQELRHKSRAGKGQCVEQ